MRYVISLEHRPDKNPMVDYGVSVFIEDTLRDERKIKVCAEENAAIIVKQLNDGWISWEEAEVLAKNPIPKQVITLEPVARLTEVVELISTNLTQVINELKEANARITALEHIVKGSPEAMKAALARYQANHSSPKPDPSNRPKGKIIREP